MGARGDQTLKWIVREKKKNLADTEHVLLVKCAKPKRVRPGRHHVNEDTFIKLPVPSSEQWALYFRTIAPEEQDEISIFALWENRLLLLDRNIFKKSEDLKCKIRLYP